MKSQGFTALMTWLWMDRSIYVSYLSTSNHCYLPFVKTLFSIGWRTTLYSRQERKRSEASLRVSWIEMGDPIAWTRRYLDFIPLYFIMTRFLRYFVSHTSCPNSSLLKRKTTSATRITITDILQNPRKHARDCLTVIVIKCGGHVEPISNYSKILIAAYWKQ